MQRSKVCVLEERHLFELEYLQEFAWTVNFRHSWRKFFVYIFAFNHTCLEPSLYVSLTYQKHRMSPSSTPHLVFLGQGLPVHLEFFGWLDWLVTKAQGLRWAGLWVPHLSFHLRPGDENSSTYAHATSTLPTELFPRPTWRKCLCVFCLCVYVPRACLMAVEAGGERQILWDQNLTGSWEQPWGFWELIFWKSFQYSQLLSYFSQTLPSRCLMLLLKTTSER